MSEYSQGIMGDGPVILKNGKPMTPEQVVADLNHKDELLCDLRMSIIDLKASLRTCANTSNAVLDQYKSL